MEGDGAGKQHIQIAALKDLSGCCKENAGEGLKAAGSPVGGHWVIEVTGDGAANSMQHCGSEDGER